MSNKSEKLPVVGVAGPKSVVKNAALDLLRERSSKTGKRRRNEDKEDKTDKVAAHCTSHQRHSYFHKEKTNAALGFSENYALTEMRSCLSRHDWAGLRRLFPLTLNCYGELEPIIWRYLLTILLCNPDRDLSHFYEFLETCVGIQTPVDDQLLEHLFTLPGREGRL